MTPGSKPSEFGNAAPANGDGSGEEVELADEEDWGQLPDKVAQDLRQGQRAAVAPEYRDAVQRYYEAIAEQSRAVSER